MIHLLSAAKTGKDNFILEKTLRKHGYKSIAGCDEVGRGPLAGPVVAAAVVLPPSIDPTIYLDSKILSHRKRELLAQSLIDLGARIGIAFIDESEIDRINILQASLLAMKIATENIEGTPVDFLLVDGKFKAPVSIDQQAMIKGESKSASIAAASIIAKVRRDQFMVCMHEKYPIYNFRKNKGYPTKEHREALKEFGPCPIHRRSFNGVVDHG
ncbi:MAG: ribonuclease HII [Desulfotalea sp.]|nr:MAG: ribonuclease HII [Desulfotalea sp.]